MPTRRPSPVRLLLVLAVACLVPVGVLAATGLAGGPVEDQVETADGGSGRRGRDGSDAQDISARAGDDRPSASSMTVASTTSTTASTTTTPTTAPPTTRAPTAPPSTAPPVTAPPTSTASRAPAPAPGDQVVALVNSARASAGCGPLRGDARLAAAAQGHSDDMASQGYFSHTSLDGRTFADRVRVAGYPNPGGENIAQGQRSAQAVHDAWMNSEGHRANILNCSFTAIGVGLHAGSWTWTQNFGY